MGKEDEQDLFEEYFGGDYRDSEGWDMSNIRQVATKRRDDADIIVQHPIREEADSEDVEYVETMGLSVTRPSMNGAFTIQNTASDSRVTERFVSLDVEMVDELIAALKRVKRDYEDGTIFDTDEGMFLCPACAYPTPFDDVNVNEELGVMQCPECDYII